MLHNLTPWAQAKIQRRTGKSARWIVYGIVEGWYEVRDGHRDAKVDMRTGECTCKKWQVSGLPCGHAITVAKYLGYTDCSCLASPFFNASVYRETYEGVILPVGPTDTWLSPDTPLPPVYPPLIRKKPVGRPRNNERRASRGEGRIVRKCSRCGQTGHNRTNCPTPAPSSEPTSRASGSQRRQSQSSTSLEPHGTLDYNSIDLNVNF